VFGVTFMRMLIVLIVLTITTPLCAQTLGSTSGASSALNVTNPASTTSRIITTPTVVPPGLAAAGVETCLGSASGGLSVMGGGITFGSTKVDEGCTIRLLARQLYAFGFQKAAVALMCQEERVAIAMNDAGSPCPPSAETRRSERLALAPALAFSQEEQAQSPAQEGLPLLIVPQEQTEPAEPEAQVKPFTLEEQAMFARASNLY
jgi:hypothetical protein